VALMEIGYPYKQTIYYSEKSDDIVVKDTTGTLFIDMRKAFDLRNSKDFETNKNCCVTFRDYIHMDSTVVVAKKTRLINFSNKLYNRKFERYGFLANKNDTNRIIFRTGRDTIMTSDFEIYAQIDSLELTLFLNNDTLTNIKLPNQKMTKLNIPMDLKKGRNFLTFDYNIKEKETNPIFITKLGLK
jgi:hypothetical protein